MTIAQTESAFAYNRGADEGIRQAQAAGYLGEMRKHILTKHETAPAIILHEQLHARSISHYGPGIYRHFSDIEESSVQLMAEEICRKNGIEIIESDYQTMIDSLKQIGQYIGVHKTDYDFAKFLIEMPVAKRLDWISDKLYVTLGRNEGATVEEYQSWSSLLDMLYTKE